MGPLLRLGRAAIRHPRRMIAAWALVVVASAVAAPGLFSSLTSDPRRLRTYDNRTARRAKCESA